MNRQLLWLFSSALFGNFIGQAQSPSPEVYETTFTPSSRTITLGQSFDLIVRARNNGGNSDYGSISISFPSLNASGDGSFVQLLGSSTDAPGYAEHPAGTLIYHRNGTQISATYLLAEFGDNNWVTSEFNYLSIRVQPKSVGTFYIYTRSTMGQGSVYTNWPVTSSSTDQQGWQVQQDFITVAPAPGTLSLTVTNISGGDPNAPGSGGRVRLFNSSGQQVGGEQTTNSSGVATFTNVSPGTGYSCQIFHEPNQSTIFSREYWGNKNGLTISSGQTTTSSFTRYMPYGSQGIQVLDGTIDVTGQTVDANTPLTFMVPIRNDGSAINTKVRLVVDRDKGGSYDRDVTSNYFSIGGGVTRPYTFTYTPAVGGNYYGIQGTTVNHSTLGEVVTDGWPWGTTPLFNVRVVNMTVNPSSLSFGNVAIGQSQDLTFSITNQSSSNDDLFYSPDVPSAPYTILNGASGSLAPGQSRSFTLRFSPTVAGTFNQNWPVTHTATNTSSPLTVLLSGTGYQGVLQQSVTPVAVQTKDWNEFVTYVIVVTDGTNPVSGAVVGGEDNLINQSFQTPPTNSLGQTTYTTTVPNGKANGVYDITFVATKSGYQSSSTVTRQVQVGTVPIIPADWGNPSDEIVQLFGRNFSIKHYLQGQYTLVFEQVSGQEQLITDRALAECVLLYATLLDNMPNGLQIRIVQLGSEISDFQDQTSWNKTQLARVRIGNGSFALAELVLKARLHITSPSSYGTVLTSYVTDNFFTYYDNLESDPQFNPMKHLFLTYKYLGASDQIDGIINYHNSIPNLITEWTNWIWKGFDGGRKIATVVSIRNGIDFSDPASVISGKVQLNSALKTVAAGFFIDLTKLGLRLYVTGDLDIEAVKMTQTALWHSEAIVELDKRIKANYEAIVSLSSSSTGKPNELASMIHQVLNEDCLLRNPLNWEYWQSQAFHVNNIRNNSIQVYGTRPVAWFVGASQSNLDTYQDAATTVLQYHELDRYAEIYSDFYVSQSSWEISSGLVNSSMKNSLEVQEDLSSVPSGFYGMPFQGNLVFKNIGTDAISGIQVTNDPTSPLSLSFSSVPQSLNSNASFTLQASCQLPLMHNGLQDNATVVPTILVTWSEDGRPFAKIVRVPIHIVSPLTSIRVIPERELYLPGENVNFEVELSTGEDLKLRPKLVLQEDPSQAWSTGVVLDHNTTTFGWQIPTGSNGKKGQYEIQFDVYNSANQLVLPSVPVSNIFTVLPVVSGSLSTVDFTNCKIITQVADQEIAERLSEAIGGAQILYLDGLTAGELLGVMQNNNMILIGGDQANVLTQYLTEGHPPGTPPKIAPNQWTQPGDVSVIQVDDPFYPVAPLGRKCVVIAGFQAQDTYTAGVKLLKEIIDLENTVQSPTLDPAPPFVFAQPITVQLSCTTPNSTIYYTLDGSQPTENSFSGTSVLISGNTNLRVRAFKAGMTPSGIVGGLYTYQPLVYSISGRITLQGGNPVSSASVVLSGSQSRSTQTNGSGDFSFAALSQGGDYTVIPSEGAFSYTPPSQTFYNLTQNQTANFTASPIQPTIFVVVPPASANWEIGSSQTVSWTSRNVSGNVNIRLSTDGGSTFLPTSLASNTANDGTEQITVPNYPSATCRIRVEAASDFNIYGDNPGNFVVTGSGNILWTPLGLLSTTANGFAFTANGDVFAGTSPGGVYRSTNNGNDWVQVNSGLTSADVRSIVVRTLDNVPPNEEIFVGTATGGVYRSTDNGDTWAPSNAGLFDLNIRTIVSTSNGYLYAWLELGWIYRSTNGGSEWSLIWGGSTEKTFLGTNLDTAYVGYASFAGSGIRYTVDGVSWGIIPRPSVIMRDMLFDTNAKYLGGDNGVLVTTNNGGSWTQINNGLANTQVGYLGRNSLGHIFCGTTDGGVYMSSNQGNDWNFASAGLTNGNIRSLEVSPAGFCFVGTASGGVFRSASSTSPPLSVVTRLFLEGPYNPSTGLMNKTLNTSGYLASKFPGVPIPAEAVDSINVEIRDSLVAASATVRKYNPAWLLSDGTIRALVDTTKAHVELSVAPGSYYIVVHHRNHLAVMSSNAVALSTSSPSYNFTTAQAQAFGTSPMKDLGGGVFGMWGGDANASGSITASDRALWQTNNGTSGYKTADLNLSGLVTASDRALWQVNNGKSTQVP